MVQANIDNTVDMEEFRFLLTGGISTGEVAPNPLPWLGDKLWAEMNRLSSFLGVVGFAEELQKAPVSSSLIAMVLQPERRSTGHPWSSVCCTCTPKAPEPAAAYLVTGNHKHCC